MEWITNLKDYLKFYKGVIIGDYSDLVLSDKVPTDGIYVDKESLIPYYQEESDKHIGVHKVNQDIILDSRIPRGIDYNSDQSVVMYVRKQNPRSKSHYE